LSSFSATPWLLILFVQNIGASIVVANDARNDYLIIGGKYFKVNENYILTTFELVLIKYFVPGV